MNKLAVMCLCLTVLALAMRAQVSAELPELNLSSQALYFSGGTADRPRPQLSLFRDASNNAIGIACLPGASTADLRQLGIQDLDERLKRLIQGHALVEKDGRYWLSFPVIVKEQRERVADMVRQAAARLAPRAEVILEQIRRALPDREGMLFHLLWSRVIDEVWDKAWKARFGGLPGPPQTAWVIYPEHPFAVGTNYDSMPGHGSLAMTWSRQRTEHLRAVEGARLEMHQAAWKQTVPSERARALAEFGLFDAELKLRVFTYHRGDPLDGLFKRLVGEYASVVSKAYDYDALGHSLHIPSGELFVILLHETVYGVFEDLSRAGKLRFPPALTSQGERKECVQLVSLRLGERPRADDEAMFLFMRSGWRGNKQTVEKFRQVLDKNPNNRDALLYLGMSLYQVQDYREAIRVFERLNRLTEHDGRPSAHDWSHIWIGHMYDLLGERDKALEQYRMALASRDSKSTMMYGQYGIGPVNAKIWAQQRIQTPFTRR